MRVRVEMFCLLVLGPALLTAAVQTLTIDSQLGTSIEDCFERITIGEQLPATAIYRNVSELTTRECEQICKQDKQCQTYDYGVGAKGNATCNLSKYGDKELRDTKLLRNPDYDIYIRRIACEQSPPNPLPPPQQDEPVDGPVHRPVFRPVDEEPKRPVDQVSADEYVRPNDVRPGYRPGYRPQYNNYYDVPYMRPQRPSYDSYRPNFPEHNHLDDRPDDYNNQRPENDQNLGYGQHRPQDIPLPPQRPARPLDNQRPKPDPYDVVDFHGPYGRPPPLSDPGLWRPDPYFPPSQEDDIHDIYGPKPIRPYPEKPLRPLSDNPNYHYVFRPNRKPYQDVPRPQQDFGYGPLRPSYDYPPMDQGYGNPGGNIGPPNHYPYRPQRPLGDEYFKPPEKPTYNYNSQYASSYGGSSYNDQDNYIYLEINDPPKPVKPLKPLSDRPGYGGEQNYPVNDRPNSGYGSGYRPTPGYGIENDRPSSGYGSSQSDRPSSGYGIQNDRPSSGLHADRPLSGYGVQNDKPTSGYGIQNDKPTSGYGNPINKPSSGYGLQNDRPTPGYGTENDGPGYGTPNNKPAPSYGAQNDRPTSNKPLYDKPSSGYGQSDDQYQRPNSGYGQNDPGYRPGNKPGSSYGGSLNDRPSSGYGQNDDHFQRPSSSYGQNDYYSGHHASGQTQSSSYGLYDHYGQNGYNRPQKDPPNYRPQKPAYGSQGYYQTDPSYSHNTQSYGSQTSSPYGNQNDQIYGDHAAAQKPQNVPFKPSYVSSSQGYGSSVNQDRPDQAYQNDVQENDEGYKNSNGHKRPGTEPARPDSHVRPNKDVRPVRPKPESANSSVASGYDRPPIKPVYEHDVERPSNVPSYLVGPNGEIVTSRPVSVSDYGARRPLGRDPAPEVDYAACFRRVLAGKRALRSYVSRVAPCERLEDCRRECANERRFHCESFNYKLDPSFRGKGLCELMTRPIESFDIQNDFVEDKNFDFYELDRNSLEPHCLETLKGPGFLHSGYLSSKPDNWIASDQKWDRYDYRGGHRGWDRGDRLQGGGRRRYQEPYIPYQIGMSRSNEDSDHWGQYGGSYGGSNTYYKDRNDYTTSRNYWQPNLDSFERPDPPYGVKPHGTYPISFDYNNLGRTEGYGHGGYAGWKRGYWNSSGVGSGLSYGESNYYRPAKPRYPIERSDEPVVVKDCSSRRQAGMSLGSGAIRRSLLARNVVECESACFNEREFKCVSYSFRYSNSQGTDNCFLSERPYRGLDLASDSGSDVYAMPQDHGCAVSQKPWVESECFWHVRSESSVSGGAVKAALTVAGLGACEAECIRAHGFFCRGFSFRFDAPTIGDELENCLLTSSPPTSLEPSSGLRKTTGHELYARGNYGRGCEPALYDETHPREKECYLQYDNAAKLIGAAVKGQARVKDEESCGLACNDAPFNCLSFSFNNAVTPGIDNCLLSEIRLFDLQRGVDYEHSTDDWLFAYDLFNAQCARQRGKTVYSSPPVELPHPPPPSDHPSGPPSGTGYLPGPAGPPGPPGPVGPVYHHDQGRPSGPAYIPAPGPPTGPGYNKPVYPASPSYRPAYPDQPGYPPPDSFKPPPPSSYGPPSGPGYKPGYPVSDPGVSGPGYPEGPLFIPAGGFKPGYGPETSYGPMPSGPGYPPDRADEEPVSSTVSAFSGRGCKLVSVCTQQQQTTYRRDTIVIVSWRHYTVSGFPCKKGTTCAQNQVAGHWACEPEGGEIGSWDYCCAPTHRCGYSEGFHKPWCYVGRATEQWRPCSEKYYPYHQHNIPHPSQGHRDEGRPHYNGRPARPAGSPYLPAEDDRRKPGYIPGPYLPEADRRYWDDLYRNGPKAYYDKYGNPLPGYARVPMEERPYIKYHHNQPRPASGHWEPVHPLDSDEMLDPPVPGGLGVPRYWPVAYLHKGPPPNITYFRYNETDQQTTTTQKYEDRSPIEPPRSQPPPEFGKPRPENDKPEGRTNYRDEKTRNITKDEELIIRPNEMISSTTPKLEIVMANTSNDKLIKENGTKADVEVVKIIENEKEEDKKVEKEKNPKGISGKLDDFSGSIEVLDIEDAKSGDKPSDVKTLEAEERQIETIGRLLASRRGGQLILEKRSQKELEAKNIAIDKALIDDFNFGNKFPTTERKGIVQKVSKDEIFKDLTNDRSLELSETTFVRPPRVLSTTDNIRKAMVNGKVFYDATIREQRDLYANHSRKLNRTTYSRVLEDSKAPSVISNQSFGKKKNIRARNVNPVRRVRRIYKKRYNPDEVRRRLLERERNKHESNGSVVKIA